jgi:Tfp pilus assembly protein PilZ
MEEKRKYPRAPLSVLLEIWAKDKQKSVGKGFITNLSEGGLALETTERLRLSDHFVLSFTLPNNWTFDVWGDIIYVKEGVLTRAYGIRFKTIQPETRTKITHYVKACLEIQQCY